ncbi:MAG: glutamate--tRNA ligase [Gammaproteobacteria bacterium RIFCSPHIGHO2_12_FULL_42_13]|nr:MAG: glutamate--tRNA ligase [Gammaproteobacteria bacterium RIFCSPHIGHO2_12_FULL_42_13]
MTMRTRFAPSPTGFLHVGGARTALFAWLYARHLGGKFILRIEDTDRERSTEASIQAILDGMSWLALDYDEGPFFQTHRMARYQEVIQQLLVEGHAYRCTCSQARLEKLRETQMQQGEKPRYDGHCRALEISSDVPHVVRFKNPTEGAVVFEDFIRGKITVENAELDDLIILRSDGYPTYNFCVVVDDHDMKITDIIRGDDHINNTPRQINMLKALNAPMPRYGHVPMILGSDGKRLSKRHGAVSVTQFREEGYLPEALLNYLVRLGWSHGDQEIFSREEMVQYFDVLHINHSPAAFDFEKLDWLNQHYIKSTHAVEAFEYQLRSLGLVIADGPETSLVYDAQKERVKTLREMAEKSRYFYEEKVEYDDAAVKKHLTDDARDLLKSAHQYFESLSPWTKESLHEAITVIAEQNGVKMGQLAQPLRVAVTGNTASPSIDTTLFLVGKTRVLARLRTSTTAL